MDQNQNQDTSSIANDPATYYHQDNRIPVDRDLHGRLTTVRFLNICLFPSPPLPHLRQLQGVQPEGVVDYGPTLGRASAHSTTWSDVQVLAPDGGGPIPSESLRTLSRRYILDPGTHVETVHIGPNRYGRLKVIITLEIADGV